MEIIKFEVNDLLNFQEIEQLIISVRPNEKASIISKKLTNYLLLNNNDFYRYDTDKILYIKEDNDDNYIITFITLFIDKSFDHLSDKDKEILQLKYKKTYDIIFRNSDINKYLPQLITYLTNNKVDFNDPHLYQIHFQNGYYDFKAGTFNKRIKGTHFINVHIKRDYVVPNQADIDRVYKDVNKIYPNKADRDYLLMTLGLSLTGKSCSEQTMLFLIGNGSSGKSTILEMCKLSLEDYIFTLPKQTFTKGFNKIDKILNTYAKKPYIRISHINEPEDTKIDDSLFKDHCDGKIQTTSLYKDGSNDFQHNSKMVFTANTFPNIKIDSGSVRRVDSFTHSSKFVKDETLVDEKKHIYSANLDFLKNASSDKKYLNAFFNILATYGFNWLTKKQIFKQTINFSNTKDAIVSSNDIIQDYIYRYLVITKNDSDRIGRDDMYDHFKVIYPKSYMTPTQLLNSLKQKEISYKADYRINKLKGCYSEIKFRDSDDDIIPVKLEVIESPEMIEKSKYDDILQQLNELKTEMLLLQNKQNTSEPELTDQELEAMFEMCL